MKTKKVYVALSEFCKNDDRPRKFLESAGFEIEENRTGKRLRREEMPTSLEGACAVLAGVEPYDGSLLASLPELRCISRCGIGTEAIDLESAKQRNIKILTTGEEVIEPVAQMTIAMILALARHFPSHLDDFRHGQWKKHTGYLLSEWTIGLVGFGRIGRKVHSYLKGFGSRVIVSDPFLQKDLLPEDVELCSLDSLLAEADVVSLHASRSAKEGPLIGSREIALMKTGGRLVNTARGHLVDELALLEALKSSRLSAAALDVFGVEPYSGPLTTLPQVLCTPHVATLTRGSRVAMELRCAINVIDFFPRE